MRTRANSSPCSRKAISVPLRIRCSTTSRIGSGTSAITRAVDSLNRSRAAAQFGACISRVVRLP